MDKEPLILTDFIPKNFERVFQRSLSIRGFLYGMGEEERKALQSFIPEVSELIVGDKIIYKEHRYEGLRKAEEALLAVHTGANLGKVVIIVSEDL